MDHEHAKSEVSFQMILSSQVVDNEIFGKFGSDCVGQDLTTNYLLHVHVSDRGPMAFLRRG